MPPILVATNGRHDWEPPSSLEAGLLLRDTDLPALIHRASQTGPPLAVDIDTISEDVEAVSRFMAEIEGEHVPNCLYRLEDFR